MRDSFFILVVSFLVAAAAGKPSFTVGQLSLSVNIKSINELTYFCVTSKSHCIMTLPFSVTVSSKRQITKRHEQGGSQ